MSYTVMARKWRPQIFDEVVAQEHIIGTLRNAIRQNRVAHAYLFSGPRGTGKTTTARLLAKALNCEQGPTPEPCGTCKYCQSIANGTSADVREIDGASTGLVDDIRQLREEVGYAATKGKRKIYIIDEVHMLSASAFNALLKTLEEPPAHVVFVFATTEAHKVPETVLSRCQRYHFRRIGAGDIAAQLRKIAVSENLAVEETALFQIARKADGGMRDALSLMDQVVAFSDSGVTEQAVQDLLGIISRDVYFDLTQAIVEKDGAAALQVVARLVAEGGDYGEFVEGLLEHFRHLLVARATGALSDEDLPEGDRARYVETAALFQESDLLRMLQAVSELEAQISRVSEPRFWLELTAMKLVEMTHSVDLADLLGRLERLEGALREGGRPSGRPAEANRPEGQGVVKGPRPTGKPRPEPERVPAPEPGGSAQKSAPPNRRELPAQNRENGIQTPRPTEPVQPSDLSLAEPLGELPSLEGLQNGWGRVVQEVKKQKISVGTFLSEGQPKSLDGSTLLVAFQKNKEFHANQVRRNRALVEDVLAAVFGCGMRLACKVDYDADAPAQAEAGFETDQRVQMVLQIFGGEVIR